MTFASTADIKTALWNGPILPAAGLTLLLGVERFMSEIRAVTNLFSNIFATLVVSRWMGELDDARLERVLNRDFEQQNLGAPSAAIEP
jgi:aerobic C4-dicarboxylate transport protein